MRCNNCGFENSPEAKTCIKCGQTLTQQSVMGYGSEYERLPYREDELKKTKLQNDGNWQEVNLRKTVIQGAKIGEQEKKTQIQSTCPRCHYPMNGDYCANCGYELQPETKPSISPKEVIDKVSIKCNNCGEEVSYSFRYCPNCGCEIEKRTINPFERKSEVKEIEQQQPQHHCSLTLIIDKEGEIEDGDIKNYCGEDIALNRENTEPGNFTITSNEQARLTFEDDKWMIQNRSDYGSTMLAANRKLHLESGDIILLGNRRFRFDDK